MRPLKRFFPDFTFYEYKSQMSIQFFAFFKAILSFDVLTMKYKIAEYIRFYVFSKNVFTVAHK